MHKGRNHARLDPTQTGVRGKVCIDVSTQGAASPRLPPETSPGLGLPTGSIPQPQHGNGTGCAHTAASHGPASCARVALHRAGPACSSRLTSHPPFLWDLLQHSSKNQSGEIQIALYSPWYRRNAGRRQHPRRHYPLI